MKTLHSFVIALMVGIASGLSIAPSWADDTELYAGQVQEIKSTDRPNILFVMDRSGSMGWYDYEKVDENTCAKNPKNRMEQLRSALLSLLDEVTNVNVGIMTFTSSGNAAIEFPITFVDENLEEVPGESSDVKPQDIATSKIAASNEDAEEGVDSKEIDLAGGELELTMRSGTDMTPGITFENTVQQKQDDARQILGGGSKSVGSVYSDSNSWLALGGSGWGKFITGLRFQKVDVPNDAKVLSAFIVFTASENTTDPDPINIKFTGVTKDARSFQENDNYISNTNRYPESDSSVTWGAIPIWQKEKTYYSPNLASVVQEIVDSSWENNDDMVFKAVRTDWEVGSGNYPDEERRAFYSYDADPAKAPRLQITYEASEAEGGVVGAGADTQDKIVVTQQLVGTNNDAYEAHGDGRHQNWNLTPGAVINNAYLTLGNAKRNTNNQRRGSVLAGFRFTDLDIPNTAQIVTAKLNFNRSHQTGTGNDRNVQVEISAQNQLNAPEFNGGNWTGTVTFDLSNRAKTNAKVTWDIPRASENRTYTTPNFATAVKEVINQPGWNRNSNSLVVLIDQVSGDGSRYVYDVQENATRSAELTIEYVVPRSAEEQMVGLRFSDVQVPQGATVTKAYIEMAAAQDGSESSSLKITAEKTGNAQAFTATKGNISERPRTTENVVWEGAELSAWQVDEKYQTPSLVKMVQEVVDEGDFCGGNAMAFILETNSGEPLRIAKSYDMDPENAPKLVVEFDKSSVKPDSCMNQSYITQISAAVDDAEEFTLRGGDDDGAVSTTSDIIELTTTGNLNNETKRVGGFRFPEIPIQQGAKILEASLTFTARDSNSETEINEKPLDLTIWGHKTGSAPEFAWGNNYDFSQRRTKTTAKVKWNLANGLGSWSAGQRYTTPDLAPIVQEIVNQSNWSNYNTMAFFVEGDGLRQAAAFDYNPSQAAILKIKIEGFLGSGDSFGYSKPVRNRLKEIVQDFSPGGMTPLPHTIYEAGMYYTGGKVTYGKDRKGQTSFRVSHEGSFENGTMYWPSGCSPDNLDSSKCSNQEILGDANYIAPEVTSCQPNFVVLLTDGVATYNSAQTNIKNFTGESSCFSVIPDDILTGKSDRWGGKITSNEQCGPDMVKALNQTDLNTSLPGKQNVVTYTVGFKMETAYDNTSCAVDTQQTKENYRGQEYLRYWADLGEGEFISADNEAQLLTAFRQIVADVVTRSTTFTSPSISVNTDNQLYHRDSAYITLFKPDKTAWWDGNLKKFNMQIKSCPEDDDTCQLGQLLDKNKKPIIDGENKISENAMGVWNISGDADGGVVTEGGAGAMIPNPANRNIYTNVSGHALTGASNHVVVENSAITSGLLKVSDAERDALIEWIRGWENKSQKKKREWMMGDSLHGKPGVLDYAGATWIYMTANDGSIRMLDADTGIEQWMFIPKEMLAIQQTLKNNPGGDRVYGIDGSPTFIISQSSLKMFVGMRRGGRSIYALNVTPTSGHPTQLWQIDGGSGDFTELGQTWSRPLPARVEGMPDVTMLLFGGGYDAETQDYTDSQDGFGPAKLGRAIYIVNASTGELEWWAGPVGSGANLELPGMDYSIPSDLLLTDMNGNGKVDRIYVGDTGGQVWRIDLGTSPNGIGALLAKLSTTGGDNQRRFFYAPDLASLQAETQYTQELYSNYDLLLISSGYRPHPLGKENQNILFAIRDRAVQGLVDEDNNGLADENEFFRTLELLNSTDETDFYDATENLLQDSKDDILKAEIEEVKERYGWYIRLDKEAGEKGLASPYISNGIAYFTTFLPPDAASTTQCVGGEGTGRLYALDILTGGAALDFGQSNGDQQSGENSGDGSGDGSDDGKDVNDRSKEIGEGIPDSPQSVYTEEIEVIVDPDNEAVNSQALIRRQVYWFNE